MLKRYCTNQPSLERGTFAYEEAVGRKSRSKSPVIIEREEKEVIGRKRRILEGSLVEVATQFLDNGGAREPVR